jgi:DNA-binding transcriptional LysR family regulator
MDTRLLRSFLSVVRTGGITTAAAELGFVQSTITAHVQALERQTGTHLLERLPGGTSPTAAGALLAERAQEILDLEDRMLAELAGTGRAAAGPVRLCAPESVCAYQLPPVLAGLREHHPQVRLSLSPATTRAALTAIIERRADLALVLEPTINASAVTVTDLGGCDLSLIAPAGFSSARPLTAAELVAAGVLLLEEGCSYSDELAALILATDPSATPARFGSVETVKRCVEAGLGLALLPTATVAAELADGRLTGLRPPAITPPRLWLAGPRSRWTSPAVQAVHEMLTLAFCPSPGDRSSDLRGPAI